MGLFGRKVTATIYEGSETVHVVGESFGDRQKTLDRICGGKTEDGHEHAEHAVLIPDPQNPHDSNAVGVFIQGRQVGNLSREDAAELGPGIRRLSSRRRGVAVPCTINGGWRRSRGSGPAEGHYGVVLHLDRSDFV